MKRRTKKKQPIRDSGQIIRKEIDPLVELVKDFDAERLRLESEGGTLSVVKTLQAILNRKIEVSVHHQSVTVQLINPESFREVSRLFYGDLHVQIRTHTITRWPCYLIARRHRGHPRSTVFEIIHRSPDYPQGSDPRFISLSGPRGERLHLNLADQLCSELPDHDYSQNDLYVIQRLMNLAWHPDQCMHWLVARLFDLPKLIEALELCYLALASTRLYSASMLNDSIIADYLKRTNRVALSDFIGACENQATRDRYALETKYKELYDQLSHEFLTLMMAEIPWEQGSYGDGYKYLYKVLYANVERMDSDFDGFASVDTSSLDDKAAETIRQIVAVA